MDARAAIRVNGTSQAAEQGALKRAQKGKVLADTGSGDAMQCNGRWWCPNDTRGHVRRRGCHGSWLSYPKGIYLGLPPAAFQHAVHHGPLIQRSLHYALQLCLQTSIYRTCGLQSAASLFCSVLASQCDRDERLSPQVSIWNASTIEFTSSPSQRQHHATAWD